MSIDKATKFYLTDKPDIPKGMFKEIKKEGILTGSYLFGGWKEDSDVDVLLHPKYHKKYSQLIEMGYACYTNTDYCNGDEDIKFLSLYVKHNKKVLNLIVFNYIDEYEKYLYATKALKQMIGIKEFDDAMLVKNYRIKLFEYFKDVSPQGISDNVYERAKNYKGTGEDVPF